MQLFYFSGPTKFTDLRGIYGPRRITGSPKVLEDGMEDWKEIWRREEVDVWHVESLGKGVGWLGRLDRFMGRA